MAEIVFPDDSSSIGIGLAVQSPAWGREPGQAGPK